MRQLSLLLAVLFIPLLAHADLASAPNLAAAQAKAKKENRLLFLMFKSADCKHCRKFTEQVLNTDVFRQFAADHLSMMIYDVDTYDDLPESERNLALSLEEKYSVDQMPAIVVFATDGVTELLRTQGYRGTPAETIVEQLKTKLSH
ncbi:MAG: thioredoxin family protein [Verrucomicrobiae bacterium]|nr:thioredoxin family protein [Verrucomicrobiae bacterium]